MEVGVESLLFTGFLAFRTKEDFVYLCKRLFQIGVDCLMMM